MHGHEVHTTLRSAYSGSNKKPGRPHVHTNSDTRTRKIGKDTSANQGSQITFYTIIENPIYKTLSQENTRSLPPILRIRILSAIIINSAGPPPTPVCCFQDPSSCTFPSKSS